VVVRATGTIVPGTQDIGNHCDNCVTSHPLPFGVRLYDRTFSRVQIGSNGTLGLVSNGNPATNTCLPSAAFNMAVLPFWDDLSTAGTGNGIFISVSGSSPRRILNIEWRAVRAGGTQRVNFEVRLHEGDSNFSLVYGRLDGGDSGATIGVQRDTGSLFTQLICNAAGAGPVGGGIEEGTELTFTLSDPPPTPCLVQFSDVPPDHTFYPFVRCLACREILSGYADGTFRSGNTLTRGQLAKIAANAAGLNEEQTGQSFEDTPASNPFHLFIERLALRGIIGGYPCGSPGEPCDETNRPYFRPYNDVTRGQAAKIIGSTALLPAPAAGQQTFTDVPPAHSFWPWIEPMTAGGIIGGYPCGSPGEPCDEANRPYFRPYNDVTRGQAAKIVANTFFPTCETLP
jgi:hypothetical protein